MRQIISPLDGFRSPFGALRGGFSPSALFALAEPGVWYDPSDVANLAWRRNLLTFTEQFDNAVWSKSNATISANNGAAPDSATTADLFYPTATGTSLIFTGSAARPQAISCYAKASGKQWVAIGTNTNTADVAFFNLQTGTVGAVGANMTSAAIQDVGSGWYRVSVVATTAAAGAVGCAFFVTDANSSLSVTASGTSGILIWGAQLELGSVATDYQRITDVNTEVIERFPTATLFQDTAGTTPVTGPSKPDGTPVTVALALDKSKGLVLGSELVTNGTFDSGVTSWTGVNATLSQSSGACVITADGLGQARASQTISTVAGRWYEARATLARGTGTVNVDLLITGITNSASVSSTTPTDVVVRFAATGATTTIRAGSSGTTAAGTTYIVDNISVRELPGFHATQATAASRPTYGIVPATGRRNLLTRTEEFNDAAWTKSASTITANSAVAPNGTTTADKLVENASAGITPLVRIILTTTNADHTFTVYLKAAERQWARILNATTGRAAYFDAANGVVGTVSAGAVASVTAVGNGWYRCSFRDLATAASQTYDVRLALSDGGLGYTGDGTSGILIWGAQLETGSTATAYQRVGSAFDVTEAGVASLSYLSFDGVDDFLVTPTITPGIDKAQVFAGVRKLTDPSFAVIAETSASFNSNAGSLLLFTNTGLNGFVSRGSLSSVTGATISATAPVTSVLTGLGDIATDVSNIRQNSIAGTAGTGDQGTGNYLAYPMYIGRRGGTLNPINMQLFSLIVRFGANLDAGTITSTETWVNGKTGAYA